MRPDWPMSPVLYIIDLSPILMSLGSLESFRNELGRGKCSSDYADAVTFIVNSEAQLRCVE